MRSQQLTNTNTGAGGRLEQSYDSPNQLYGRNVLAGRPKNIQDASSRTVQNNSGMTKQSNTITIGTAAVALYTLAFAIGVDNLSAIVSYQSVAGDTNTIIQAKLLDALRASRAGSRLSFAAGAGTTITATSVDAGTNGGFDLTASGGGAGFSEVETIAPKDPGLLSYGRVVVAVPSEQTVGNPSIPNGVGGVASVRYARTAADLQFIVGILLRSEFNGLDYFGGPSQDPHLAPGLVGTVFERGDIAVDCLKGFVPGPLLHVYLESAGPDKAGLLASAADPDGVSTAPIPTPSFLNVWAVTPLAAGDTGYVNIK
jgi:hypothetical protein